MERLRRAASTRGRSPRGCSAPRRRSSRRSTAGPSSRRRGRGSSRASARARARVYVCEVAHRHHARPPDVVGCRRDGRVLHRVRRSRRRSRRGRSPSAPRCAIRSYVAREVGVAEARCRRRAASRRGRGRAPRSPGCRRTRRRACCVWSKNVWSTTKPFVATRMPGCSACSSVIVPYFSQRLVPRRERAGHADRQAAPARVVERQRHAVRPERVGVIACGRGLAPVDRRRPCPRGADDHEAAAADAARERLGHAEDARGGDRRVDGVAAGLQRVDRGLRRERLDARGGAARPDRRRRTVRRDGCRRRDAEDQHEYEEQRNE